jgi:uncharacterized protein with HEPN domain
MQREDRAHISDIIVAGEKVARFVAGRQRHDLDIDDMLQLACIRGIEIIGEAAANVSSDACDAYPEVPWRKMVGMRNRLVHAYFEIDLDIVWKTATEELPLLLSILRKIEAEQ